MNFISQIYQRYYGRKKQHDINSSKTEIQNDDFIQEHDNYLLLCVTLTYFELTLNRDCSVLQYSELWFSNAHSLICIVIDF